MKLILFELGQQTVLLTGAQIFAITVTKLYVPVVTLSTQNNAKLLKQLKSGFKQKLSRYQSNGEQISPNSYLNHLTLCQVLQINKCFDFHFMLFAVMNYIVYETLHKLHKND